MKFKKLTLTLCLTVLCMNHVNAESHYDSLSTIVITDHTLMVIYMQPSNAFILL